MAEKQRYESKPKVPNASHPGGKDSSMKVGSKCPEGIKFPLPDHPDLSKR